MPSVEVIPLFKGANAQAVRDARRWLEVAEGVGFQTEITAPTLTTFLPPANTANGTAMVLCPGGGYRGQATKLEGYEPALWLNSIGVAAFVLTYRLPGGDATVTNPPAPLIDARRALRLVRFNSKKWNVNPARVGIMGFSAGGHLAAMATTRFADAGPPSGTPSASDEVDRPSARPDFTVLLYPVISMQRDITHMGSRTALLGEEPTAESIQFYSPQCNVTAATPPTFVCHAKDDPGVPVENSIQFYEALKKAGVPAKLLLYAHGGHGFGLGVGKGAIAKWPQRCAAWLKSLEFISSV